MKLLSAIRALLKGATARPWKCWNGWGPSKRDGLTRCERIGNENREGIAPSNPAKCPDMAAKTEDFELVCHAVNNIEAMADVCERAEAVHEYGVVAGGRTMHEGNQDFERDRYIRELQPLLDGLSEAVRKLRAAGNGTGAGE